MEGLLTINSVRATDEGDYTCIASNEIGMIDTLTFNLSVASESKECLSLIPVLSVNPSICPSVFLCFYICIFLVCFSTCIAMYFILPGYILTMLMYQSTGFIFVSLYLLFPLTALPLPPLPPHPLGRPNINWPPRSQVLSIGQTLTLRCKAVGSPQPVIRWQFNSTTVRF